MYVKVTSIIITICLAFFVIKSNSTAQTAQMPEISDEAIASIQALIDNLIEDGAPGYAVGVVVDDKHVFSHYAGLANLDTPTPIDENTRFNIASVAKQFTALMILDLAHQGKVDLSKDFRAYLPNAMPLVEKPISIAQVLTHTSGIRDVYDLFFLTNGTWYETDFNNRTARNLLRKQTGLNFEPGSSHLYSNSNYILLADLIAEVQGQPFHVYANEFLKNRGMSNSTVRRRYGTVIPRLARAYGHWGTEWIENADIANTHGDGFFFHNFI